MHSTFNRANRGRYPGGAPFFRPLVKQHHVWPTPRSRGGGSFTGDHYISHRGGMAHSLDPGWCRWLGSASVPKKNFAAVRLEILRSSSSRATAHPCWQRVQFPPNGESHPSPANVLRITLRFVELKWRLPAWDGICLAHFAGAVCSNSGLAELDDIAPDRDDNRLRKGEPLRGVVQNNGVGTHDDGLVFIGEIPVRILR